jgi:hypothetical protein
VLAWTRHSSAFLSAIRQSDFVALDPAGTLGFARKKRSPSVDRKRLREAEKKGVSIVTARVLGQKSHFSPRPPASLGFLDRDAQSFRKRRMLDLHALVRPRSLVLHQQLPSAFHSPPRASTADELTVAHPIARVSLFTACWTRHEMAGIISVHGLVTFGFKANAARQRDAAHSSYEN